MTLLLGAFHDKLIRTNELASYLDPTVYERCLYQS